ncbi:ATP phosphoribosyltransferase regulatory subunit [Desulfitobacterium dichloroeliminans LMG P-21439]|uniref:ATP phosphoribosyltransferase regulatory subunit n=1 Tax=Desulfitobacterium dichloroeliminans (strain LMG P-21439 / DCA1) TaxID=871963 RepID=L0F6U1_DESDL|nr:ATP phosphoribosyltransferase regulatory subunit [Desulfitobacterium dichloroeliminans]AGA68745.1 ATP phosphoribosyltransferase regulatory subunit [Desulfitobacterium dichloroeliminans LMG P-21439]
MPRSSLGLRIPEGMHDILPNELALQDQAEDSVLDLFKAWAYQKIVTPTLEYGACIEPVEEEGDAFFKLFDRQGHVLVLRPELTTPIARMVSTRMRGGNLPLRLCYSADVYRYSKSHKQEFRQVGVELVGSASPLADAEVIALACEALGRISVRGFQINLGHMGIFTGIMDELGVSETFRINYQEKLARKDFVGIERLVKECGLEGRVQEILLKLPHLHGTEEMLGQVLEWSQEPILIKAVEVLRQVYHYLRDFGVQDKVSLDLGILRGFSYYTGAVFEGYVPGVGFPIVEGGRYDSLYGEFGDDYPATGFAINLKAIIEQLPPSQADLAEIFIYGQDTSKVITETQRLRQEGKKVEMSLVPLNQGEAEELATRKGFKDVYCVK